MSGPGPAVVCKGKEVHARDHPGPNDVLAGFQVKPEVTITNWPCSKEKGERKHINRKDLLKACVHELLKFAVPDDETCYRRRDISTTVISRVAGGYGRTPGKSCSKIRIMAQPSHRPPDVRRH